MYTVLIFVLQYEKNTKTSSVRVGDWSHGVVHNKVQSLNNNKLTKKQLST